MKWLNFGIIGTVILTMAPQSALAQGDIKEMAKSLIEKVGIHGNLSFREPVDSDVTKGRTLGVSVGLSPGRNNGWKYPAALTMFSEDLHSANGTTFATVQSRALIGGIGYGWHFGHLATGVQFQVGYAFNQEDLVGNMMQAFAAPDASIDVGNAWLMLPKVKAEYFITHKFTVRTSLDYVRMRPDVVVNAGGVPVPNRWDMSNMHASVGIGFYPFRK